MLKLFGFLLVIVIVVAVLRSFIWIMERDGVRKEAWLDKSIRQRNEEIRREHESNMKFALWGVCNQIELQRILEESRRNKCRR